MEAALGCIARAEKWDKVRYLRRAGLPSVPQLCGCPQYGFSALLAVLPAQTLRPGPAELHEAPCLLAASVQLPGFCSVWCPWSMASVKKAYSTWDLALHRP